MPQPALEAAGVGVDILNVEALVDVLATTGDERDVQDVLGVRKDRVGIASIGNQHSVFRNDRCEVGRERGRPEIMQNVIRRRAAAVAHD